MNTRKPFLKIVVFLSGILLLAGAVQVPQSAWASMEDAAIFYDELDQHGEWVEYGNYGPVWYPTKVQDNWRPYVDGRWTPAEEGYVFETQEPWGWATYHYGNWMPTEEYGWVWVPGRTWYPNTVTWRTSPETDSPGDSYIGWAPIPPPSYTPQPGYYPEGYYGGGPYRGPFESLITAPFWIFVQAANFLLGFSEPYAPSYSYWGCGCLAPPPVVPYYYNRTVVVHNYYTPDYYPRGYWAGRGYYNWGPPIPYVARVTRIKQVNINNYIRRVNIYHRRNVAPPPGLVARRAYFRDVLPPAMVKHHPLPRGKRVWDVQMVRGNLARPHLVKADMIKHHPAIRAHIPQTRVTEGQSGQWRHGIPGAALPSSAMMRHNRQMDDHVRKIPSSQRIQPASPQARHWQVPRTPGTTTGQPVSLHPRRGPEPTSAAAVSSTGTAPGAAGTRMRPGPQGTPATVSSGTPGGASGTWGRPSRTPTSQGMASRGPSPSQAAPPPQSSKPGKRQQAGGWSRQRQAPPQAVTSGQPAGQGQQPRYTPGTPTHRTAAPVQVQPQRRPPTPQASPQRQPKQQQKHQQFQKRKPSKPDQSRGYWSGKPTLTRTQPGYRQSPPQSSRQVRQQPAPQPRPQVRQQPRPQAQPQVRQQPRPQPQRQVRQQPRYQPQPQVRQQPRPQPQRQVRQQPRQQPQRQRQVRQQPRPQPQRQAQNRSQTQPQQRRHKQVSEQN